ncbi:hypothetical protein F5Y19DRAFT_257909 [Xylariaceae sp. FL1651]|nr:hypothetical protein F5Y19DRAFT_257909 [Xylariaceae sp. FL1651]
MVLPGLFCILPISIHCRRAPSSQTNGVSHSVNLLHLLPPFSSGFPPHPTTEPVHERIAKTNENPPYGSLVTYYTESGSSIHEPAAIITTGHPSPKVKFLPSTPITHKPNPIVIMPVKPRCTFKECRTAAQRIVGDCGFCDGHFCAKHRLLEDHKCTGLEDCKKESHERNAAQLEAERTQVIRGV